MQPFAQAALVEIVAAARGVSPHTLASGPGARRARVEVLETDNAPPDADLLERAMLRAFAFGSFSLAVFRGFSVVGAHTNQLYKSTQAKFLSRDISDPSPKS